MLLQTKICEPCFSIYPKYFYSSYVFTAKACCRKQFRITNSCVHALESAFRVISFANRIPFLFIELKWQYIGDLNACSSILSSSFALASLDQRFSNCGARAYRKVENKRLFKKSFIYWKEAKQSKFDFYKK